MSKSTERVQEGIRSGFIVLLERFKKWFSSLLEPLFEAAGAVAVRAGPGFSAVFVAAVFAIMRVLHFQDVEIFFPIRTFFVQRDGAETRFYPMSDAVFAETGLFHVVNIFVTGDGAAAERAVANGAQKRFFFARFDPGFHQITHRKT